ncbi:complement component receptor 1-like protein isoform X1 [Eriocheir sinensis]|uniref:complement component receptor 1-like protein isoform X1 n=1 Tax=Eriocheir sinensis TaxID=95602 RepID=UPI0021C6D27D|nr:complement component receptor 1-like protein isoform X1 [Eriocheir sinensis]XP_050707903.1 complement component receptor 1-like protein isoform X1 [Eriocheir sinensis]XP_050707904.1 complement component receptor 1-like protein isoform X1 [Eriocheir sinensis]XP_050707905.1 complement component receptor 1-like protein isoform X1 [Eriocheir sinensis]
MDDFLMLEVHSLTPRPARHDLPRHQLSGGTARHFLKKALLPLTGWCDSLLLLEVRCPNLTTTLTTALSVVVEDRGRVEATADYSCEKGRRIVGNSQRKCGSNGIWSGSQPRCEYVTCDLPQGLDNGRIVRLNQTLEYGSLVEYHCLPEHRLVGGSFRRSCGELGEWLGGEPKCVLDVTCDLPQGLDNGRIVRLNQTLEYGSLVEYHCLPEHRLVGGSFRRSCGELGEWLGGEPKCVLGPEDAYNTIGSDSSSSSSVSTTSTSTASNTGLYIGLFFGLILAIVFIGVLVYFRMFWAPSRTRELTVLASGQVAKMRQCQCLECHCAWPSSAARHTMASSCPPLSGSALTR